MAETFQDGIEALKARVADSGIAGEWSESSGGKYSFKSRQRGIINFWATTGRVNYQGPEGAQAPLKAILAGDAPAPAPQADPDDGRTKIFVVHGHDTIALEQLELVLRRLGLDPYILQNNDGGSNTIIESLEQNIYQNAAFGIILMTPDDFGYSKARGEEGRQPRARQNVILELGMVLASLGRNRMVILKKQALETPSDVDGVLRLEFNDHVKEVAVRLASRMKAAGIAIDESLIAGCGA